MRLPLPPLNALRAFEAAARHLSFAKAADELNVTPGALSHQIRTLEEFLGVRLFDRKVRSVSLTVEGDQLVPGLQTGFSHIRGAVEDLMHRSQTNALVVSTPPGFTSKWLAPRLWRFSSAQPDTDARVSSSVNLANFRTDGVHVAVRMLAVPPPASPDLDVDKLIDVRLVAVASPKLVPKSIRKPTLEGLKGLRLIHDESHPAMPGWSDWLALAGVTGVEVSRGMRFNSSDHALDAAIEGAGLLLTNNVLAYDDLRTGRLIAPFKLQLATQRAYYLASPRSRRSQPQVAAFKAWMKGEIEKMRTAP